MRTKYLLVFLLSLSAWQISFSQNYIKGIWVGKFSDYASNLGQPKIVVEVFDFKDSLFTGISHLYYPGHKYEHYKIVGRFIKKDSLVMFKEVVTIAVDLGAYNNCPGTYLMKLSYKANKDMLDGMWISNQKGCTPDVKVWFRKDRPKIEIPVPEKKRVPAKRPPVNKKNPDPKLPKLKKPANPTFNEPTITVKKDAPVIKTSPAVMPSVLRQRETDVQSLLEIAASDKDSIKVDVYDNGEIDGDSASVYEEGIQRIGNKRITAKPITFYVSLNKNVNPIVHLRLVAENLGTIPPCTALMIVTTKSRRYEVHLSSNFSKNATVELFLKE